ncbi:MAG: phage adaptor protein [Solirubrobacteraceae bacterium]
MRNQTVGQLKATLRAELRQSSNPGVAQSSDHILVNALKQAQSWVHSQFWWPHMRSRQDIILQAGESLYTWPPGMDYENVESVQVKFGGRWLPVKPFTEDDETYNAFDTDKNVRSDPVIRYRISTAGTQIEVWPLPSSNGVAASAGDGALRIKGLLRPPELSGDGVVCPFDDGLITQVAAAKCSRTKDERNAYMQEAASLMKALTSKSSTATNFHIGGAQGAPIRRIRELVVRVVSN